MSDQELTAAAILAADDIKRERVEVPEWGGHVYVRVMTGGERDDFEASCLLGNRPNLRKVRAKLACLTVVDSRGARLFNGQINELAEKSGAALDRIFEAAQRINRMGERELRELTGNSERDQSADSGSD